MPIAVVAEGSINGEEIGFHQALRRSFSWWGRAILANLWATLKVLGLTLLLIVPGVVYLIYYTFVTNTVVLRGKSGKAALDYSENLVRGNWWKVLSISLFLLIAFLITRFPTKRFLSPLFPDAVWPCASQIIADILGSFYWLALTIFFLNLDYRKMAVIEEGEGLHQVRFKRVHREGAGSRLLCQ